MRGRLSLLAVTCVAALCAVCLFAFVFDAPITQDSAFGVPNHDQVTSLDPATTPAFYDSAGVLSPDEPCIMFRSAFQPIPAMTPATTPAPTSARNVVRLCPMC